MLLLKSLNRMRTFAYEEKNKGRAWSKHVQPKESSGRRVSRTTNRKLIINKIQNKTIPPPKKSQQKKNLISQHQSIWNMLQWMTARTSDFMAVGLRCDWMATKYWCKSSLCCRVQKTKQTKTNPSQHWAQFLSPFVVHFLDHSIGWCLYGCSCYTSHSPHGHLRRFACHGFRFWIILYATATYLIIYSSVLYFVI